MPGDIPALGEDSAVSLVTVPAFADFLSLLFSPSIFAFKRFA